MKILIDMNIPRSYASLLTKGGIEAICWSDIGAPDVADSEIMEYARNNDFIVLTCDLDFSAILSATKAQKPSVAQVRTSIVHTDETVDLIKAALLHYSDELVKGAIISIDTKNARVRLLPL